MTVEKLQEILQSDEPLTLEQIKQIIYELKNDCVVQSYDENLWKAGFYTGEGNAFYICLDLLSKMYPSPYEIGLRDSINKNTKKILNALKEANNDQRKAD